MRRLFQVTFCTIPLLFLAGCGGSSDAPDLVEAQGVVTYKGQPLPNANVVFHPESGPVAIGQTDAQGMVQMRTSGQPGAPVGTHAVTVTAFEASTGTSSESEESVGTPAAKADQSPPKSLIPERFAKPNTSQLKITIPEAGDKNFKIELGE